MKLNIIAIVILGLLIIGCKDKKSSSNNTASADSKTVKKSTQAFQNKGHELVYHLVEKVGNHKVLWSKKDVVYRYTYTTPDGKSDVSIEKYLFNGELSYGFYQQHERTLANLKGAIEQGYDGKTFWLKNNGAVIKDTTALKRVVFSRPTNFYWFTMFQKLLDPGLKYEYLSEQTIDGSLYDIVKVSFETTGDKPTDIYQLYINKDTGLVDQFLFTVADFGVVEKPFLMKVDYEQIDNLLIPTKRRYKPSTWNADVSEAPWIQVSWEEIKFNNGLSKDDFKV